MDGEEERAVALDACGPGRDLGIASGSEGIDMGGETSALIFSSSRG